jgi:hypothetical protein
VKLNSTASKNYVEPGIDRIINIYKFSPYVTDETLHLHYKNEIFNASIRKIFQLFTLWTNGTVFYVTVGDIFTPEQTRVGKPCSKDGWFLYSHRSNEKVLHGKKVRRKTRGRW